LQPIVIPNVNSATTASRILVFIVFLQFAGGQRMEEVQWLPIHSA